MLEKIGRSSLEDLFKKGNKHWPPAAYHSYASLEKLDRSNASLDARRREFYLQLKEEIPAWPKVYYPGSGSDPVPLAVFKHSVAYSSLNEEDSFYYEGLMGRDVAPRRYKPAIEAYGPFDEINVIYANALQSPFMDQSLDVVIVNSIPVWVMSPMLVSEVWRVLKPGGIFVYEDDVQVSKQGSLEKNYEAFLRDIEEKEFKKHRLDKFGGVMGVTYVTDPEEDFGVMLTKSDFLRLKTPGALQGHEIRVFQKSKNAV